MLIPDSFSCTEELACANAAGLAAPESVTVDLQAGETIRIFVDGIPGAGTPGPFELQLEQLWRAPSA